MMAQNPNLRAVKPLSRYMDLSVRMVGRQRLALEYMTSGNNQVNVVLPFTPDAPENLEIYLNNIRVLGESTINKNVVHFTKPQNGTLLFISDSVMVDPGLKWLEVPTQNLIQSNDYQATAYGTDRRAEHQVATFTRPYVISQGGIGFCRPSADNSKLLYCSLYGRYGRDTITYALMTDAGQLSDYRCIDIRVRDPNYVPTIRLMAISPVSRPLKVDGVVVDIEPNGEWVMYGETLGGRVELPNVLTLDELNEYHFVIQGRDEEGKWFELSEYFEEGEYQLVYTHNSEFVITQQGSTEDWGFTNGERLSIMCKQSRSSIFAIGLVVNNKTIFQASILGRGPEVLPVMGVPRQLTASKFTYVKDPDETNSEVIWDVDAEEASPYGITSTTSFRNEQFESHRVELQYSGTVTFSDPLYDPANQAYTKAVHDVSKTISGRFVTAENPEESMVLVEDSSITLLPKTMLWRSPDIWSNMYVYEPLMFTYTNRWYIR